MLGLYQALGALGCIVRPLLRGTDCGLDPRAPFFLGGALLLAALLIALAELDRERLSHPYVQGLVSERARVGDHVIALTIICIEAEMAWLDTF